MKQKLLSFFLLCSLLTSMLYAQERRVSGTVTSKEEGTPLPGVSVSVTGTTVGTQTDSQGNYSLAVPIGATSLTFTYIGYTSITEVIGNGNTINAILGANSSELSEVVVTGYATRNRSDLTGSISTVTAEDIANRPVLSFDQALTAKAAGVNINTSSGLIGDNVFIRIRGASSISSGSQPLIVLDGIPLTQGDQGQLYNPSNPLADINPSDIESFEILKDASSTAIYGSRGAAGVILITTKKGKAGFSSVDYSSFIGFNESTRKLNVLSGDQYNTVMNKLGVANGYGDIDGDGQEDVTNTDWQDELFRKGLIQNHQLAMNGGNEKTTYYGSVNYNDNNSFVQVNRQKRWTARLNINSKVNKWLETGINTQYGRTTTNGLGSGTGGALSGNPFGPLTAIPNVPVYGADGDYYLGLGGNVQGNNTPNPVAVQKLNYDNLYSKRFLGSAYGQINIIEGLRLKTQINLDYMDNAGDQYWNNKVGDGQGLNELHQRTSTEFDTWDWFNTIQYTKKIGDHSIDVLGGTEYTRRKSKGMYWYGLDVIDPALLQINPDNYNTTGVEEFTLSIDDGLTSYFGSANYGYKGKYLATFNFRADGYSAFGKNNRYGYFPSGSIGWVISKEDFMQNVSFVNELKLRGSYGYSGNSNIGYYPSIATYQNTQYADLIGSTLTNPGNPDLVWEKTRQFDIGFDASIWKGTSITFDYYDRESKDLILKNPVLATLGFPDNQITQNVGTLVNRGAELTVGTPIISRSDFSWNINFNFSYNWNRVTATNEAGDAIDKLFNTARPGYVLGAFNLIEWAGVNPANGNPRFFDIDGNIKEYDMQTGTTWFDADGNETTPITANDRVVQKDKSPYPKYFGGLTNTFRYKDFDLSLDLQYSFGSYMFNRTKQNLMNYNSANNKSTDILDAWTGPGQNTDVPVLAAYGASQWSTLASTRWLEKNDFLRLRNIQLGYNLPKETVGLLGIKNARLYVMVQNLFTITGYSGIDPESNSSTSEADDSNDNNIAVGVDYFRLYLPRTYTFGVSVGF